jgi:hypothetical protein
MGYRLEVVRRAVVPRPHPLRATSALPDGWRDRLVKVQNANTAAPIGEPQFMGWCLDKEDWARTGVPTLQYTDRAQRDRDIPELHVATPDGAPTDLPDLGDQVP